MAANVPAFVTSSYPNAGWPAYMMIGNTYYQVPGSPKGAAWWFVVVDLRTLEVVANEATQDGTTIPASVQQHVGDPNYFLFFAGNMMWGGYFPQGPLYAMLVQIGAAKRLPWMEQIVQQTGTGYFISFSYILAATMTSNDLPGFEEFGDNNRSTMTFEFMPVTVGGQTIYTPIQNFPSPSAEAGKQAATPKGLAVSAQ